MWQLWLTSTHNRLLRFGIRFVICWLASGIIAWWLFPRIFWVDSERLLLWHAAMTSYLMAWSMRFNAGGAPVTRAMISGTLAGPLTLMLNLMFLSIYTPTIVMRPLSLGSLIGLLTGLVVGGLVVLVAGAIGSAVGVLFAEVPRLYEQPKSA